jgi:hypothetical protein
MPNRMPTIDEVGQVMRLIADGDAETAFLAIDALAGALFGHRLFTVTRSLHATEEVERVYSSNPDLYPVGGRKQKQGTPWGDQVLNRGQVLICHGADDIRRVFSDHEVILRLGITGMINVPVLLAGRSMATMNMGHADDRFSLDDSPAMAMLAGLALPLVLA